MFKDMGDPELTGTVRRLLELYEGVTVDLVRCHPSGAANIVLRSTNVASLGRLASCAQNANLAFYVWADHPAKEWADRVRFELRAGPDPDGAEYPSVEHLCVDMANQLVECARLDRAERDRLLGIWHSR